MARKLDAAKNKWSWKIGYKRQAGALDLFGACLGPILFGDHLGLFGTHLLFVWGPFGPGTARNFGHGNFGTRPGTDHHCVWLPFRGGLWHQSIQAIVWCTRIMSLQSLYL